MILDEIVLHNFGVYSGRQTVGLSPPSPKKPVVLFGGMNGGGKTTLLDGLHLALYGKRAKCSNRGSLSYDEFLRRAVHRKAPTDEGAAVELQFRHRSEGVEHTYRVHRSWSTTESSVRERLEVMKDGKLDRVLTDTWNEQVEEFLPIGLSQLFLFDGEKIESLADLDNSAQLLGTAINSLLGLEVVDQLNSDLTALERRKKSYLRSDQEQRLIVELQQEVGSLDEALGLATQRRASAQNDLDAAIKRVKSAEERFRRDGGDLFEQRALLDAERAHTERELSGVEERLRELVSGPAPLLLLRPLLDVMAGQADLEARTVQANALSGLLEERDAAVVAILARALPDASVTQVKVVLDEDRQARRPGGESKLYLNLSHEGNDLLRSLRTGGFEAIEREASRLLEQFDQVRRRLVDVERKLSGIPDEASIAALLKSRDEARAAVAAARARLAALDEQAAIQRARRDTAQARLATAMEKAVEGDLERDDIGRLLSHSSRVRTTLGQFRDRVVHAHVRRIESLVLECFRRLLRKRSLVESLEIDPRSFRVEIKGPQGHRVDPARLSAGERQLLAVALLWGLARASGRPLPSVIDTPLGRLDSSHRGHLVEHYFPFASHQVLLLSTDEEIDPAQFDRLKPWVGRTYRLEFDDHSNATRVESGYFWS